MKLFKRSRVDTPPQPPSDHAQRLAGVRSVAHDADERQSREDADYGQTIFTRPPVPLPRALTGGKR
jgi:hypothetical protein